MPLNDQMRLLQTSWPEVLSLSLAFRSMPVNSGQPKLQWSSDFFMTEKEARDCGMEELFFQVIDTPFYRLVDACLTFSIFRRIQSASRLRNGLNSCR